MAGDEADKKAGQGPEHEAEREAEAAREQGGGEAEASGPEAAREGDPGEDEVQARITEAVEAALGEQRDALLRAQAEVQNVRRRCEQDVEKAHKFALEKFSTELLSVVDNLERALEAVPADTDNVQVRALYEGVELTLKSFRESLAKFNIEPVDPQGEPFDPQLHEAMSMQENGEVEPNTVLAVMQKGYTLNGRVIRPARVVVARAPQHPDS